MYNDDYVLRIRNYAYIWYFYSPDSPTRNPRNRLKIPLSPGNGNLPFPDPPIPRGSFPVGELASLVVIMTVGQPLGFGSRNVELNLQLHHLY